MIVMSHIRNIVLLHEVKGKKSNPKNECGIKKSKKRKDNAGWHLG